MSFLDVSELASLGNNIDQLFYEEPDNKKALMNSLNEHRGFTKTDAILYLKKGCPYVTTMVYTCTRLRTRTNY